MLSQGIRYHSNTSFAGEIPAKMMFCPKVRKDYYPFGMLMPGRTYTAGTAQNYRYGMNGQEKDDEIYGKGNSYSAEFWQYDARIGRRWNQDPRPNPAISNYATFANNPILFSDPMGDSVSFKTHEEFWDVLSASISSGAFAQKVNELRKSENTFTYNNTGVRQGVVGSIENTSENIYQINYTTNSIGQENQLGQSPFHSLFEETFHATEFNQGDPSVSINPETNLLQTNDPQNFEARAWKWTADNAPNAKTSYSFYSRTPSGQISINPFYNTTVTTKAPLIMQMKSANIEQIKTMLFQGYIIPYTNTQGSIRNMEFKGPYK